MIFWLTGNTGAGKTTLAKQMADAKTVILDGDDMRYIWQDLTMSKEHRIEQNLRVARLAKSIEKQGFTVIVAVICPYESLRKEVKEITDCMFIYLPYGRENTKEFPYEIPKHSDLIHRRKNEELR